MYMHGLYIFSNSIKVSVLLTVSYTDFKEFKRDWKPIQKNMLHFRTLKGIM